MKIHRVKEGESIFSIANEYAISPLKIIENNRISNPNQLCVGEELLILTPTRTYTVRANDSLEGICRRFLTNESEIIAKNPSLQGSGTIYAGQILSIKCDTPPYGVAFANGYYYQGCSNHRLKFALPYLSYVSVCAGKILNDDVKLLFDDSRVMKEIRSAGKIPLLHLSSSLSPSELDDSLIDTAILLAKARGYDGINLSLNKISDFDEYSDFLLSLRKNLLEYDLILFVEADKNQEAKIKECYDGINLSYTKAHLKNPPSFAEGEDKIFRDFSEEAETSKAYIELSSFAFADGEALSVDEAIDHARAKKCQIFYDEKTMLNYFDIPYQKHKKRVVFESLESIKARLDLISELGFMGISVDIMRVPLQYLLMFDSLFRPRVCPSLLF